MLELYRIYDHPSDYPTCWVVCRSWLLRSGETRQHPECWQFASVDAAREFIWRELPRAALLQPAGADRDARVHELWGAIPVSVD